MAPIAVGRIISMPDGPIRDVRTLFMKMEMTSGEFRTFTRNIRSAASKHLDDSGARSIEGQEKIALQRFLDHVKTRDPTIARRYPYFWVVWAYLELYISGKRRHPGAAGKRPRSRAQYTAPIWIRYAYSQKIGKSLYETSEEIFCNTRVSHRTIPAPKIQKPNYKLVKNATKKSRLAKVVVPKVETDITKPSLTTTNAPMSKPVPAVAVRVNSDGSTRTTGSFGSLFKSIGPTIGSLCASFVGGVV